MITLIILALALIYVSSRWFRYHRYRKNRATPQMLDSGLLERINTGGQTHEP